MAQPVRSASSFSSEGHSGGFKGSSEYTRSQLEASAAQKDTYFSRKMQVLLLGPHVSACMPSCVHACVPTCAAHLALTLQVR